MSTLIPFKFSRKHCQKVATSTAQGTNVARGNREDGNRKIYVDQNVYLRKLFGSGQFAINIVPLSTNLRLLCRLFPLQSSSDLIETISKASSSLMLKDDRLRYIHSLLLEELKNQSYYPRFHLLVSSKKVIIALYSFLGPTLLGLVSVEALAVASGANF